MLPKIGPWHERPAAMAGGGIFLDDVGAGDVRRHQVGRELDALEDQAERLRDGADHQRLRRAGQAGDQAVAADEERDQDLVEHFVLPDDDLAHLREDAVAHRVKALDALLEFSGVQVDFSRSGHRSIFLSRESLELQEQFLRRADNRARLRARQHVVLGLVLLAGGEVGLRQVELRPALSSGCMATTAAYSRIAPA